MNRARRAWRVMRAGVAPGVVVAATLRVIVFLFRGELLAWAAPLRGVLAAVVPLALFAAVTLPGSPLVRRRAGRSIGAVASRFWLAFVPLLALGAAPTVGVLGASWVAFGFALARRGVPRPGRVEAVASLGLVLAACALYVLIGFRAKGHCDNDALYYFGVARHMARTWRYEEPIVWQFLAPAASLVHRPFDYWQGLTSVLLVLPLRIGGNTHHVALVTMAVVSSLGLLGFWYLVTWAVPVRSRLARLVACFGFAFAPGMATYRFDTESVPVFQLALVASLAAFARRSYALSVACALGMVLARGEGVWACAFVWVACAWRAFVERAGERPARRLAPALLAAGLMLAYVGYNALLFRSPLPPGARAAPLASAYFDLFSSGLPEVPASPLTVAQARLEEGYITARFVAAVEALRSAGFASRPEVWLVLVCVTGVGVVGAGPPVLSLAWVVVFGGTFLAAWSNPIYFASHRSAHVMLPAVWLLGAAALGRLAAALDRWARGPHRRARTLAAGLATFALACFVVETTPLYGERRTEEGRWKLSGQLRRLVPVLDGKPLAAIRSWAVMADTTSPVLQVPFNGEAAMVSAFKKYGVAWLVLDDAPGGMQASAPLLEAIARGERKRLGDLRLEKVDNPSELPLFRVMGPGPSP